MPLSDKKLAARVQEMEGRLAKIETKLGIHPTPPPAPIPVPKKPEKPPEPARSSDEAKTGGLLGLIAILCFILAASYIIKLAIASGWMTPERQMGLATILGLGLIGAGIGIKAEDRRYVSLLPGAGIVILYMTAYAGSLYYGIYDAWTTVKAAMAVSAVALGLFYHRKEDLYVVAATVGTYTTSLMFPELRGAGLDSMIYFLCWDFVFAAFAVMLGSRLMILMSAYLAIGCFVATTPWAKVWANNEQLWSAAAFQALQFSIFLVATLRYSLRHKKPLTTDEAWSYFPLLLFFYAVEYMLIDRAAPKLAPYMALIFAALVQCAYHFAKKSLKEGALGSSAMLSLFTGLVILHAFYFELLPDRWAPWAGIVCFAALPFLSRKLELAGRHAGYAAVLGIVIGLTFIRTLFGYNIDGRLELMGLNILLAAMFVASYLMRGQMGIDKKAFTDADVFWNIALIAGNLQALVGLSRLAEEVEKSMQMATAGDYFTTALWAVWGAMLMVWAGHDRDKRLGRTAVGVLLLAAGKGLLVDVSGQAPVVRILCLLFLGGVLYLSGYFYRRKMDWAPES